jgi:hypothetical protein
MLELALVNYAMSKCIGQGFRPYATPDLVRESVMEKCGFQPRGDSTQIYNVEGTGLCLTGTAEIPLGGVFMDQVRSGFVANTIMTSSSLWCSSASPCNSTSNITTTSSTTTDDDDDNIPVIFVIIYIHPPPPGIIKNKDNLLTHMLWPCVLLIDIGCVRITQEDGRFRPLFSHGGGCGRTRGQGSLSRPSIHQGRDVRGMYR